MIGSQVLHNEFSNRNGILFIEGTSAAELVSKYGTPLYVTSRRRIEENYKTMHEKFKKHFRKFSIKYAVKANSNPNIIRVLSECGAGADVSNLIELNLAREGGMKVSEMLMSPNNLAKEELRAAANEGATINFDDTGQMKLIADSLPETVCFRVNPGVGKGEFPGTTTAGPEAKFGIPETHIVEAYRQAMSFGAQKFGIQMMTGSNVLDPEYFGASTSRLMRIVSRISGELGINFDFVDIGGGYGVPYRPGEQNLDLDKVAENVHNSMETAMKSSGSEIPELLVEPGRYLVSDSTVLLATVTNVKKYEKTFVGTDAGMNTLMRPALYGAYHPIVVANRMNERQSLKADVVGQICENTDRLGKDREIPEVEYGDIIAVLDAGAYGYSMSNQFNGHGRAAEVMVEQGKERLIRRAENLQDLTGNVIYSA